MVDLRLSRQLLVDWVPSVVLAAAGTHELLYNHSSFAEWLPAEVLVWILVVRRRAPELVLLATLALAMVGWLGGDLLISQLGVLVALHAVAAQRSRAVALTAAGLVELAALFVSVRFAPSGSINDAVILLTGLTMTALLLGTTQRAQHQYLTALEERAAQLERERNHKALIAAAEERTRIAREIHDIVAHSVSVMIALSEGAAATSDLDRSRGSMRQVAATGRQALAELRRVLSVLNAPDEQSRVPQPSMAGLPSLVRDVELAGVQVTLDVDGDLDKLPEALQATIFRIVQESLTNTLKHAPEADRASIRVYVGADRVSLEVRDNGGSPAGDHAAIMSGPTAGNGIRGMTERAGLYGGELAAGAGSHGWVVTCALDLTGTASA